MPEALVTGGAGFIGATLVWMLAGRGYQVRVYDDLSTGSREHLDELGVELVEGDVRDLDRLTQASRGADAVFHLAAGAGVVDSIENPLGNFDVNARGTVTALWAARQAGIPRRLRDGCRGRSLLERLRAALGAQDQRDPAAHPQDHGR